jgi:hypothetical protein
MWSGATLAAIESHGHEPRRGLQRVEDADRLDGLEKIKPETFFHALAVDGG